MQEILRVYEENAWLKEELAAVQVSGLREEVAKLRQELIATQVSVADESSYSLCSACLSTLTFLVSLARKSWFGEPGQCSDQAEGYGRG